MTLKEVRETESSIKEVARAILAVIENKSHEIMLESYNDKKVEFSGKLSSSWVLVAKRRESFGELPLIENQKGDPIWIPLKHDDFVGLVHHLQSGSRFVIGNIGLQLDLFDGFFD